MDIPRLVVEEYYDSGKNIVMEIENNGKRLLIIRQNGLQMLSAEERHCFWENIQKMTEVMFRMNQFLSDVIFLRKDRY